MRFPLVVLTIDSHLFIPYVLTIVEHTKTFSSCLTIASVVFVFSVESHPVVAPLSAGNALVHSQATRCATLSGSGTT